jgi:hypothetical protein
MEERIIYVGLDVHKDTIAVALAEAGKRGDVREYGKIANTPAALRTLWRRSWRVMAGAFDFAMRPALAVTAFSAS